MWAFTDFFRAIKITNTFTICQSLDLFSTRIYPPSCHSSACNWHFRWKNLLQIKRKVYIQWLQKDHQQKNTIKVVFVVFICLFFIVRLSSVLRGHSVFHPRHNGQEDSKDFYTRSYPLQYFFYLNLWERASIFPFQCWVLNKGTTGTIFITSLVWRCPWLGIELGTSRTRSQHSTTRLSRRR